MTLPLPKQTNPTSSTKSIITPTIPTSPPFVCKAPEKKMQQRAKEEQMERASVKLPLLRNSQPQLPRRLCPSPYLEFRLLHHLVHTELMHILSIYITNCTSINGESRYRAILLIRTLTLLSLMDIHHLQADIHTCQHGILLVNSLIMDYRLRRVQPHIRIRNILLRFLLLLHQI